MSLRDQIAILEELDVVDAHLRRIDDQLTTERATLAGMKTEQRELEEKLASDRASVAEMEKVRNELTAEARQMATQIERSRDKLARSRNERESNAAQRELEELRKLQRDREDEVGKLSTLLEAARATIETTEGAHAKVMTELGGQESEINARLGTVVAEREVKAADRARLAAKVQPMTLRRYDQVRLRKRGSAIAKTIDGTCLACHMSLPPMLFQKLMRSDVFEQCPSCARILYYEAPTDPPTT